MVGVAGRSKTGRTFSCASMYLLTHRSTQLISPTLRSDSPDIFTTHFLKHKLLILYKAQKQVIHVRIAMTGTLKTLKNLQEYSTVPHAQANTPANQQSVDGVAFPHRAGRYRPGGSLFRPRVVGVVHVREDL